MNNSDVIKPLTHDRDSVFSIFSSCFSLVEFDDSGFQIMKTYASVSQEIKTTH